MEDDFIYVSSVSLQFLSNSKLSILHHPFLGLQLGKFGSRFRILPPGGANITENSHQEGGG